MFMGRLGVKQVHPRSPTMMLLYSSHALCLEATPTLFVQASLL
jgi:hypothetical protein